MKELQYLNKYFIKYKYRFLLGIFITIVAQIFSLFTPKLISRSFKLIEEYTQNAVALAAVKSQLLQNIALILGTTIIAGILTFVCAFASAYYYMRNLNATCVKPTCPTKTE